MLAIGVPALGGGGATALQLVHGAGFEAVIRKNFRVDPMVPPSSIYGPGSLYVVRYDGGIERIVCSAADIDDRSRLSRLPDVVEVASFASSSGGSFNLLGGFVPDLSASGAREVSVKISNVRMYELDDTSRIEIFRKLSQNEFCAQAIRRAQQDGLCVSQSYKSLMANGRIELRGENGGELGASDAEEKISDDIKRQLAEQVEGNLSATFNTILDGRDMFFGFKLYDRCIEAGDVNYVRRTPNTAWWHLIAVQNTLGEARASLLAWWDEDSTDGSSAIASAR
ncbi:hypothetical protein [Afifella marina]|nr:hypothetical protein [Afifella marina]